MIDEKKLIEEIENTGFFIAGLRSGREMLRKYLTEYRKAIVKIINNQPKVDNWIPCSERLPEESGYYLATIENAKFPQILHYLKGYKRWRDEFSERKYVVAWQPLPTPYNEKRGGKNE